MKCFCLPPPPAPPNPRPAGGASMRPPRGRVWRPAPPRRKVWGVSRRPCDPHGTGRFAARSNLCATGVSLGPCPIIALLLRPKWKKRIEAAFPPCVGKQKMTVIGHRQTRPHRPALFSLRGGKGGQVSKSAHRRRAPRPERMFSLRGGKGGQVSKSAFGRRAVRAVVASITNR